MTYTLVFTRRAEKDIKKLDPSIKKRLGKALLRLRENPKQLSEQLTDPRIGTYRFRMGDYRVIFDIEDKDITVLRVGHRSDIYKRV